MSPYKYSNNNSFFNLCSNEVIVNIIYPSTVNKIDGYLYLTISPTLLRYNISRDKLKKIKEREVKVVIFLGLKRRT